MRVACVLAASANLGRRRAILRIVLSWDQGLEQWFPPGFGSPIICSKLGSKFPIIPGKPAFFGFPGNKGSPTSARVHIGLGIRPKLTQEYRAVLGDCAGRFGLDFPIRYDFLDTVEGGNLSIQCHPRPGYARKHFGETFTQDECYYILDCSPGARVYLGFQAGINPPEFRQALEHSAAQQP